MLETIIKYITIYLVEFYELSAEMAPYLILGFIFAGILHVYIKKEKIAKYLGGKNFKSVLNASLLGVPLPLCSCGVIPAGVSFAKNGASKGAAVSFLISTPQTGADSVLATYSLLGWPFALARPVVALITGVIGGLFTNLQERNEELEQVKEQKEEEEIEGSKFSRFLNYAFVEFLQDISKWLVIGLALAALLSAVLPDEFFSSYIDNPILSMFIILAASIPLYVCATGSVPIAAVLMLKGLSPGAALVFLMAGPATNMATITVIGKSLGKKALIAYLASIIGGALVFGFIIDTFFPADFFTSIISKGHAHSHFLPDWLKAGSVILLTGLIINGYINKLRKQKQSKIVTTKIKGMENIKVTVKGMTCNHCKASVEKNLGKMEGLDQIIATPGTNSVEITGEKIDLKKIEEVVNELGFEYVGK